MEIHHVCKKMGQNHGEAPHGHLMTLAQVVTNSPWFIVNMSQIGPAAVPHNSVGIPIELRFNKIPRFGCTARHTDTYIVL